MYSVAEGDEELHLIDRPSQEYVDTKDKLAAAVCGWKHVTILWRIHICGCARILVHRTSLW